MQAWTGRQIYPDLREYGKKEVMKVAENASQVQQLRRSASATTTKEKAAPLA
jgi:hypothetical protein